MFTLRPYQQQASDAAVEFFRDKSSKVNGVIVLPTGAGKSVVIADIISKFPDEPILIFQPNKEILEQNYKKLIAYDVLDCSIFSASMNRKDISRVTFATIRSADKHPELFDHFRMVIIDECHLCNSEDGMYRRFLKRKNRKILGLTATPFRLHSSQQRAILKVIINTTPRIFGKFLYVCQVEELLKRDYLAHLRYFDMPQLDTRRIKVNSTGRDYDEKSLKNAYVEQEFGTSVRDIVIRLLHPKTGVPRKGILVFTQFVEESMALVEQVEGVAIVTGETPKKERERILEDFKAGRIKVVTNVGVLTTGFDYPELDTIVLARPTMSLGLYYQMVGRAIRPYEGKDGWVVDLCGNISRFGNVDDILVLPDYQSQSYQVFGQVSVNGRRPILKMLTNRLM